MDRGSYCIYTQHVFPKHLGSELRKNRDKHGTPNVTGMYTLDVFVLLFVSRRSKLSMGQVFVLGLNG